MILKKMAQNQTTTEHNTTQESMNCVYNSWDVLRLVPETPVINID